MTIDPDRTNRKFPCFVAAFNEAASSLGIPEAFVEWGAIFAVSAALGRRVWISNVKGAVYPNVYVLMIAPPGSGKTQTERILRPMFRDLGLKVTAQHVSQAALIDELADGQLVDQIDGKPYTFHQATVLASEMGETFQGYHLPMLSMLSDWWDCPLIVRERKRHLKEPIEIHNTYCTMLCGVQPGILAEQFPSQAWQGGFLSRTIFVYVPNIEDIYLYNLDSTYEDSTMDLDYDDHIALVSDLEEIRSMRGQMAQDETYIQAYIDWKRHKMMPMPRHPRLHHYNTRREHQMEKLSIIAAASRGSMTRTGEDFWKALRWLEAAEANIDEVFIEMAVNDEMALMQDLHNYVWKCAKAPDNPVAESRVYQYLAGKVPSQRIEAFLVAAERAGFIRLQCKPPHYHRLVYPAVVSPVSITGGEPGQIEEV